MAAVEPTAELLTNPIARYLLATRPPFLLASIAPCLIGLAVAYRDGAAPHVLLAVLTVLGAALVHAGVNVLNDYYDALNGTDAINTDRIFPFTGGSRFIQNGVLTPAETARYGVALLALGAALGVALAIASGPGLWLIGAAGLFLGWAYSAPPVSLNSRGLGELSVALGFGVLIPLGADYVQRGAFSWSPVVAALPYAALVANLLYINQFPDRRADEVAGKRHWVVRLGARRARWGYLALAVFAYTALVVAVVLHALPLAALVALLPALASFAAARDLLRHAETPERLAPAIQLTILAMIGHGLLLSAALAWG
jgi:1,4-dihydroxy-2-naphthoate octaprenyltransferase